jgi:hypothetical protein
MTGRVRREATSRADATRMCAAKSNAYQERSRRDKERKKCSKGLDNCGHIEGLTALSKALVGFQGRGCADGVPPDFCHALLLEALIFQWP